jgi:hypothetical protein
LFTIQRLRLSLSVELLSARYWVSVIQIIEKISSFVAVVDCIIVGIKTTETSINREDIEAFLRRFFTIIVSN